MIKTQTTETLFGLVRLSILNFQIRIVFAQGMAGITGRFTQAQTSTPNVGAATSGFAFEDKNGVPTPRPG